MANCQHQHTSWIEISRASNRASQEASPLWLTDTGRLDRLVGRLRNPARQFPQIVVCIGKEKKEELSGGLFPGHLRPNVSSTSRFLSIVADSSQASCDRPVFVADCTLDAPELTKRGLPKCHETKSSTEAWSLQPSKSVDTIMTRLVFPFTDLVCLFAEDLGGLDAAMDRLEVWSAMERATTLPRQALPRVCVIISGPLTAEVQIQDEACRARLKTLKHHNHFSSVQLLRLYSEVSSSSYRDLREVLESELGTVCTAKTNQLVRFSARHLSGFFSVAVSHFLTSTSDCFDFVVGSRAHRPVPLQYPEQISALLSLRERHSLPFETVVTLISSCLLMDAYPSSCHDFLACDVFQELYADMLKTALHAGYVSRLLPFHRDRQDKMVARCCDRILAKFIRLKHESSNENRWSIRQHRTVLGAIRHGIDPKLLRSSECCLSCLAAPPQHVLECGHALCDACVRTFAKAQIGEESSYVVEDCFLCPAESNLRVQLKPATAGIRILSIDGGGVRGVVPLEFLSKLQNAIGGKAQIQDYFDVAFGTSAGGLIVLGMFAKQWSISHCTESFSQVAKRIFAPSLNRSRGLIGAMYVLVHCLLRDDGLYDVEPIVSSFQQSFGVISRLFDHPASSSSRSKYAVTATKVEDTAAVVFSNYNLPCVEGSDRSSIVLTEDLKPQQELDIPSRTAYRRFTRSCLDEEPFLWELARATSAAPPYFSPASIGDHGKHQDGGLRNPNPTDIAIAESHLMWQDQTRTDLLLTLGTGRISRGSDDGSTLRQGKLWNNTLMRLFRWSRSRLLEALDGEEVHRKLEESLDETTAARYIRWNPEFADGLPRLDDLGSMERLRDVVKSSTYDEEVLKIKTAILASSFFFELHRAPRYCRGGTYVCEGAIRIRGDSFLVLELLGSFGLKRMELVKKRIEPAKSEKAKQVDNGVVLGDVDVSGGVCSRCGLFNQEVKFNIRDLDEESVISLRFGRDREHRISGFPQKMDWFCEQQGLYDVFSSRHESSSPCICRRSLEVRPLLTSRKRGSSCQRSATNPCKKRVPRTVSARCSIRDDKLASNAAEMVGPEVSQAEDMSKQYRVVPQVATPA